VNFLLIEALERYDHFYGDTLRVECPTRSGRLMNLREVARELASRLVRIFRPDEHGRRPCHGADGRFADDCRGATWSSSTSISTPRPAKGSAPAIRRLDRAGHSVAGRLLPINRWWDWSVTEIYTGKR